MTNWSHAGMAQSWRVNSLRAQQTNLASKEQLKIESRSPQKLSDAVQIN